jgi:hypothetical protein
VRVLDLNDLIDWLAQTSANFQIRRPRIEIDAHHSKFHRLAPTSAQGETK